MNDTCSDPEALIDRLGLIPHPEGGHYRQSWAASGAGRPGATCIFFLLRQGERSHWHRVDADELWLWHAGHPLTVLRAASDHGPASQARLGPDILSGETPQLLVPKDHWQATEAPLGWGLVSCVVSPGFTFEGFTLAPAGFDIPLG